MIRKYLAIAALVLATTSVATGQSVHEPDHIEEVEITGSIYEQHSWDLPGTDCRTVSSLDASWDVLASQLGGFVATSSTTPPYFAIIDHSSLDENGEYPQPPTHTSSWWQANNVLVCKTMEWFLIEAVPPGDLL